MTHHKETCCQDILNNLCAYVDGDLDAKTCQQIELHLETCHKCRVIVDTLKKTISIYQWDGKETHLPDEIRSRLFMKLALNDVNRNE